MALEKAILKNADFPGDDPLKCLFNPSEYTVARTNNWEQRAVVGKDVPALTFAGGGGRTLTLDLFFDVNEDKNGDVSKHIDKLWKLTKVDDRLKNSKTKRARPPLCRLEWGSKWEFTAAITSLSVKYTLFREDGTPVRATAAVTFQEGQDEKDQPGTNPTSVVLEPGMKRREVRTHDTLALIAHQEYGNPGLWRVIAEANHIDDPINLTPGTILSIPPAP